MRDEGVIYAADHPLLNTSGLVFVFVFLGRTIHLYSALILSHTHKSSTEKILCLQRQLRNTVTERRQRRQTLRRVWNNKV